MEDLDSLEIIIGSLRAAMIAEYVKKGNLTDESVVALSQELDIYLVKFQRLQTSQHPTDKPTLD